MLKRMLPAALAAVLSIGAVLPVLADHRDRWRDRDEYRGGRVRARAGARGQLAARADRIARRAENLHRDGRLSREHRDRTLEKLERVWSDSENRTRMDGQRIQANERWLDQVEQTLEEWSHSDSRRFRR